MDALSRLNEIGPAEAYAELSRCCGASQWVAAMTARRPFPDRATLRARFGRAGPWAAGEQAGVQAASEEMLGALAEENRAYEARFGYIFIVCATGKTADEMLALLRARLLTDPRDEIRVAAAEQAKITRIRLEKLLSA